MKPTALDVFLVTVADLYQSSPEYRAELDQERDPSPTITLPRPVSTWDRLGELEWLIRNGMSIWLACEQFGWTVETAQVTATRWRHPVHARLLPEVEEALSGEWARKWLAGIAA